MSNSQATVEGACPHVPQELQFASQELRLASEVLPLASQELPLLARSQKPPIRRGVIGILHDADRYLLIQRAPGVALGGAWCFPGGHIEPNENARRAVVRELHEELGIHVRPFHRLGAVAGRTDVMLAIWLVEHVAGEFHARESEIAAMAWLTANEIRTHPRGLPSNLPVVDRLEAWRCNGQG
ncbi:MAG: NUDIX domain-containing protein [Phycisphaerales bacterium]|nr:NUDIX domain-containing protein [Phycisphaerales bacterium]